MKRSMAIAVSLLLGTSAYAENGDIIRDGEYLFLEAQHGEAWAVQDKNIDAKLAEIRDANGGKPPNIVYVLIDDVSFGILGNRAMNYVTGINTPNINDFAEQGMSLMRMYTEPSCTPTRTAMLTGRHPVRAGQEEVKVALVGEGLAAEEVTIAEILKEVGYNTAHVGKWHQGDIEQSFPHNQGFDWAAFPVHQQVQLSLMTQDAMKANNMIGFDPSGETNPFAIDQRFRPYGLVTGLEAEVGKQAREVHMEAGEVWTQAKYHEMNVRYQAQAVEQINSLAAKDEPFFMQYWPLYPLNFVYDQEQQKSRNGGYMAEKMELLDEWLGEFFAAIENTGKADNTIVVLMSDNGIFNYYSPNSGMMELIYRGGKTQHLEGGVRTDAFVRWPGVIPADSAAGDIVHVSDLFTTFARIAGGTDHIPRDRVIDGVDQTALLIEGEGNSRRDYVYVYEGPLLRSVVKQDIKMHMPAPGLPGAAAPVFNLLRDPREMNPIIGIALWSGASFQDMTKRHMNMIAKYPHLPIGKGVPYGGIENLRPESIETREVFDSWH